MTNIQKLREMFSALCDEEAAIKSAIDPIRERLGELRKTGGLDAAAKMAVLKAQLEAAKGAPQGDGGKFGNRLSELKAKKSKVSKALMAFVEAEKVIGEL